MEDKELLERYRATKDQAHLSMLYKKYMHLVYGSCLKYYKQSSDAEDAVMEIYENLVSKTLSSDIKYFKSWLYTVTRNHCLEQLRKKSTHADKKNEAEFMYYDQAFHPDTVDKDLEVEILHECIGLLDHVQRTCVEMFYFKKMAYLEIAKSLDINLGQVRSRIQNGRRNIKICMGKKLKRSGD